MSCCKNIGEKVSRHPQSPVSPQTNNSVTNYTVEATSFYKGKYKLRGPNAKGQSFQCFPRGLMYKIIDDNRWSYYNDTQDMELHVKVIFGPKSEVTALNNTLKTRDETDAHVLFLQVFPGETEAFCVGKYDGYKSSLSAKPLSDAYRVQVAGVSARKVQGELDQLKSKCKTLDLEQILDTCISKNILFIDSKFPPLQVSLSRENIDCRIPAVPWQRPTEYLKDSDIKKFHGIDPTDIDQGNLGDCWLLCSIACLAEFPSRVEKLFLHPVSGYRASQEEAVGAYRVTLNINGWWSTVTIDNYLPTLGGQPYFARNKADLSELWVSLLEKAYAKTHGSYACITGGDALLALQDLTGYPVTRYDTEWEAACKSEQLSNELFEQLTRYDECQYLINLNTPGSHSAYSGSPLKLDDKHQEEHYKSVGLGIGHAYTVLTCKYFPAHNLRLLKIRNPWGGSIEWKGKWSDNDSSWDKCPDVKRQCNLVRADDGTFWMEWSDVRKYFDGGGVCFTKLNWFDYRVRSSFSGVIPDVVLEVSVTQPLTVFITLSQQDKRALLPNDPNSQYSAMMLSVAHREANKHVVHLNSTSDTDKPSPKYTFSVSRDHSLQYTFEPSKCPYLIIPRVHEPNHQNKKYTIGLISERMVGAGFKVQFKKIERENRVFDNFPKFTYEKDDVKVVTAEFQFMPSNSGPVNKIGSELAH